MRRHFCIGHFVVSKFQIRHGFFRLAFQIIRPTQAVIDVRRLRLKLVSALHQSKTLLTGGLLRQHGIAQGIHRIGIVWTQNQLLLQVFQGVFRTVELIRQQNAALCIQFCQQIHIRCATGHLFIDFFAVFAVHHHRVLLIVNPQQFQTLCLALLVQAVGRWLAGLDIVQLLAHLGPIFALSRSRGQNHAFIELVVCIVDFRCPLRAFCGLVLAKCHHSQQSRRAIALPHITALIHLAQKHFGIAIVFLFHRQNTGL